ncbi:hypothetical protein CH337_14640 [Rhodoblastus acidophilus]|nr:hypothetical protein CH337_14640 [Rhodoblastus acidophilus]
MPSSFELARLQSERNALAAERDSLMKEREELAGRLSALAQDAARLGQDRDRHGAAFDEIVDLYNRLRASGAWPVVRLLRSVRRRVDRMGRIAAAEIARPREQIRPPAENEVAYASAFLQAKEAKGLFNAGWYGAQPLAASCRFIQEPLPVGLAPQARLKYERDSAHIAKKYPMLSDDWISYRLCNLEMIDRTLGAVAQPEFRKSAPNPSFSFVSFFQAKACFAQLARSIAQVAQDWSDDKVEWIILNNDPSTSDAELMALAPASIAQWTRIIGVKQKTGVSAGLNMALKAARHDWILPIDIQDLILPDALTILTHYIKTFDRCRFISAGAVDMDEDNGVLRYRRHEASANQIHRAGMIAGHLNAIRRDLFTDKGFFDERFDLSYDHEFALRIAKDENILLIPEYLHGYRWSRERRRAHKTAWQNVVTQHLTGMLPNRADVDRAKTPPVLDIDRARPIRTGATIVRSQGSRPDLFAETLASIEQQQFPVTPIVVAHGDGATYAKVRDLCARLGSKAVVLHAGEPGRLRGYPCNVGLDYIRAHADRFDFVSFLDDDDIYYPNFARRLADALQFARADLVYSQANRREPWREHEMGPELFPAACLVASNFITNSCFALRTEALLRSDVRFAENMEYLEDWDFLIALLRKGLRFAPLFETLSEFRIFSDGNTEQKKFPDLFETCHQICCDNGRKAAKDLGLPSFYESLLAFNFDRRPPLDDRSTERILSARALFEAEWLGATA